ncbi:MAG TPA: IPT/TIG domain-containing protein [Candidatus Acidoferrum sp.]|nr:IPT/TIG domain-containing protein [Candidatus Acidoferrum sp.]
MINTTRASVAVRNLSISALLLDLFLAAAGCSGGYSGGGSAPYISGLSVASGPVGTAVTITGSHFGATQGTSTITFSGKAASPTSWSDTSINAPVPTGATTGPVVVTVGGLASNGSTFTVTSAPAPNIASLNPTSGPVGTSVTITGTNFGPSQGSSTVNFNGTAAMPTSWNAATIVAPVPAGATSGYVVVTVNGVASNSINFTVTASPSAPTITSLNPTSGPVGTSVTITGTNFGASQGASTVMFNGSSATSTSWSATSIVAPVPAGATTGIVVVTVGGVASNGMNFTVTTSGSKWPIKANGRYFTDASGAPWLMVGDSAHHLVNVLDPSSWPTYFASRQSQGFNTVNIIELTHGNPVANGGLPNGQLPFTGTLPSLCNGGATNPDYDLSTPNPSFWSVMDQFINGRGGVEHGRSF